MAVIDIFALLNNTSVFILRINKKGKILHTATDTIEHLFFKNLSGKNLSEIFPDDVARKLLDATETTSSKLLLKKSLITIPYRDQSISMEVYIIAEENSYLIFLSNITFYQKLNQIVKDHNSIVKEYSQLISLFDSIDHIIYVADMENYEILFVNKTLQDRVDYPLTGKLCYKEFQNLDSPCPFCTNHIIKNNNYQPYYWEFYNKKLDKYFHLTDRVIKWPDGRDVRFELAVDITKQKKLEKELKILAATDELTGLWNRRHFIHQGNHEFERALRYNTPFSLILLDIDWFKKINDSYGHLAGDMVLKKLSRIVLNNLRELDVCARIGGDEFGIILTNTDISGALALAERLRKSVEKKTFVYEVNKFNTTISIGITEYKKVFTSFEEMFKMVDIALYEAKRKGRNVIVSK
ncbi:MAG: GGDEF domain-containing protein [Candidatus Omnitrophica bacterium]|nr:GGDEF domain-containing protein [Candidatus Omnitrophota bacterium]